MSERPSGAVRSKLSGSSNSIVALAPSVFFSMVVVLTFAGPSLADVNITELENHVVRIEIGGKLFTEYRYEDGFFPILYPIIGPNGESVTRHFPMKEGVPNEQDDHPHHQGDCAILGKMA